MTLKFKVDENLPREVVAELQSAGHDVVTVFDQQLNGHPDDEVANVCRDEVRIILTLDADFADIPHVSAQRICRYRSS